MKRGKPMKRTGFQQKQRKPIAATSKKRDAQNRDRKKALAEVMFRSNGRCEASPVMAAHGIEEARNCRTYGTDGHEKLTRGRGGSITDPNNILWVCRPCHDWITDHPAEALTAGLVESQFENRETGFANHETTPDPGRAVPSETPMLNPPKVRSDGTY